MAAPAGLDVREEGGTAVSDAGRWMHLRQTVRSPLQSGRRPMPRSPASLPAGHRASAPCGRQPGTAPTCVGGALAGPVSAPQAITAVQAAAGARPRAGLAPGGGQAAGIRPGCRARVMPRRCGSTV